MQHTHTHKAVTRRVEAKKLLSRRRQSNYSYKWQFQVKNLVTDKSESFKTRKSEHNSNRVKPLKKD